MIDSIYNTYYPSLVKTAYYYLGCEMDAEDIVQNVFLHVLGKQNTSIYNIYYIKKAVKNECLDYIRLKQKTKYIYCFEDAEFEYLLNNYHHHESVELNDEIYNSEDITKNIGQAIANLPDKCRQIFIECKIKGKKHTDIASNYNISIKTIENQMNIAYRKLRVSLNNAI